MYLVRVRARVRAKARARVRVMVRVSVRVRVRTRRAAGALAQSTPAAAHHVPRGSVRVRVGFRSRVGVRSRTRVRVRTRIRAKVRVRDRVYSSQPRCISLRRLTPTNASPNPDHKPNHLHPYEGQREPAEVAGHTPG